MAVPLTASSLDPGIHLVHKNAGETSFAVVKALLDQQIKAGRRLRLCHAGALDPFASGLLLILAGPATRLMDALHPVPKTYQAVIAWGAETENGDPTGKVIATGDASLLSETRIEDAFARFVGWRNQVPPATSNKRIGGERAYQKAHRGEAVELPASRVYLHSGTWISHDLPRSSRIRIVSGGGYYVRALVTELGRSLGSRAHLSELQRTQIGPWKDPPPAKRIHIGGDGVLPWCSTRMFSDQERGELRAKRRIPIGTLNPGSWAPPYPLKNPLVRAYHQDRLVALLAKSERSLRLTVDLGRGF